MVEIRYTWSPLGEPAKWKGEEEAEVVQQYRTQSRVRQAVIEIRVTSTITTCTTCTISFVFCQEDGTVFPSFH